MKNINVYLLFITISFISNIGLPQDSDQWKQITEKDGLPADRILSLELDSLGNIWATSKKGISKYEGKNWQHFSEKDGLPPSYAYSVFLDSKDNYWIIHDKGINKYDGNNLILVENLKVKDIRWTYLDKKDNIWIIEKGKIIIYNGNSINIIEDKNINHVWCYLEDSKGNLWIGGISGRIAASPWNSFLYIYDGTELIKQTTKNELPFREIYFIYEDDDGSILIGTDYGLYKKEKGSTSLLFDDFELQKSFEKQFFSVMPDKDGNLNFLLLKRKGLGARIRYNGNIVRLKGDTWELSPEFMINNWDEFLPRYISLLDSKGNIWISYDNGVVKCNGDEIIKYGEEIGFFNNSTVAWVLKFHEDSLGNFWVGSTQGLYRYDGKNWKNFYEYIRSKRVNDICEDSEGNLYIGTTKGIFIYNY